jgi:hypothetical protein
MPPFYEALVLTDKGLAFFLFFTSRFAIMTRSHGLWLLRTADPGLTRLSQLGVISGQFHFVTVHAPKKRSLSGWIKVRQ